MQQIVYAIQFKGQAAPGGPAGAQPAPAHNSRAYWIKVSAQRDRTFAVTNQRNGFTKTYATR